MSRIVFDHTCLRALLDGDPFINGLYVEASHGLATLVVPAFSLVAAERERTGTQDRVVRALRLAEYAPFIAVHAAIHALWTQSVDWRVVHPAALHLQQQADGEESHLLSYEPDLYSGTGITPINPK